MRDNFMNGVGLARLWEKVKAIFTPLGSRVSALEPKVTETATKVESLQNEIDTLVLKYMTDVNGITFSVNFSTLSGLRVTGGSWNEVEGRIEF